VLVFSVPQLPAPMLVVKFSALGFGEKPQQAARVVVVTLDVVVVVVDRVVVVTVTHPQSIVVGSGVHA
jgi:hypothetical protein